MMKCIWKMRQKKGAVLFTVVAVMALLIAMASTAYYTARSAYNSVVSNYNYSQLYLSAISVSDMVAQAVTNDNIVAANATNNYKDLRDAILTLETEGAKITAHSSNISAPDAGEHSIIDELENEDSLIAGSLDGITVEIILSDAPHPNTDPSENLVSGPVTDPTDSNIKWYWYEYKYTFRTTAYYRNNSIIVEDIVSTVKAWKYKLNPGSPGSDPTPGGNNDNTLFSNFLTATGQVLNADENGEADVIRTGRLVKIDVFDINDDAFYQNEHTFFTGDTADNEFKGGIQSTGSVYLLKMVTNIPDRTSDPATANDWFIGEDLVMAHNASDLDLGNNNLYVGRDFVIANNGKITASDIYVEGDLYILGQATIDGNLHVTGNIYYEIPETATKPDGSTHSTAYTNIQLGGYSIPDSWGHFGNGWTVSGTLDTSANTTINFPEWATQGEWPVTNANISVNGTGSQVTNGTNPGTGTYNSENVTVIVTNRVPDENDYNNNGITDEYVSIPSTAPGISVSTAISQQTGTNIEYPNYTSPSSAYYETDASGNPKQPLTQNTVTVDFENILPNLEPYPPQVEGPDGTIPEIEYYEYWYDNGTPEDNSDDVYVKTQTATNYGHVEVTLPYIDGGYTLVIPENAAEKTPTAPVTYYVPTVPDDGNENNGSETLPIVLAANTTAANGKPGFSWHGDGTNAHMVNVIAQGEGNVVFETGNYTGVDGSGKPTGYIPYDTDNYANIESVVYVADEYQFIGNQAQFDLVKGGNPDSQDNLDASDCTVMYKPGTTTPKDEYKDQFMLVSNVNRGVAYEVNKLNTFCGYIYSPNGEMMRTNNSQQVPVFGGMIISTYDLHHSNIFYAEPNPDTINQMLGGLDALSAGSGNSTPSQPGTAPTPPDGSGSWDSTKVPTEEWEIKGSNYVG